MENTVRPNVIMRVRGQEYGLNVTDVGRMYIEVPNISKHQRVRSFFAVNLAKRGGGIESLAAADMRIGNMGVDLIGVL